MGSNNIPFYSQKKDNNYQFDWNSVHKWVPQYPDGSPKIEKKKMRPVPEEERIMFLANKLDMLDGFEIQETEDGGTKKIGDGKIAKKYWNDFADSAGIPRLDDSKQFIQIEDAAKMLQDLKDTNPNLFYDLPIKMGIVKKYIDENSENKKEQIKINSDEDDSTFWAKSERFITKPYNKAAWEAIKIHVGGNGAKFMDNPDKYVNTNKPTVKDVRNAIREITAKASDYPLSKQLLELSVTPELTYLRRRYVDKNTKNLIYSVLDESQTQAIIKKLKIPRINPNPIKTILFEKESQASKIVSNDERIKEVAELWLKEKKPDIYFEGTLNSSRDTAWSINKCYFVGLNRTETKDNYIVTGYIEDIYNFEEKEHNDTVTEKLNHMGVKAQEIGAIEPYRLLIPFSITIPKE